ncbi:ATP-binding protein [uncultured Thalassolituus sp.]|uniref:ATP-binding protein n=1 Tax=uncultured Thalassolituus sp. TaxID=285273 RepID=UPI0026251744|nr:ATP-binding protein [uncultured Thalassolituus sp.]
MKLRTQLFLLIAVLCVMMAFSAIVFFRLSVETGFSQYLEEREPPFLKTLQRQLETYYSQHGSWQALLPQWWEFVDQHTAPPGPPPGDRPAAEHKPDDRPPPQANDGPDMREGGPPRLPLFLLDADRSLLAGTERAEPGTLLSPLTVDDQVVGWLGLAPRPEDTDRRNQGFLDEQLSNLLIITLVLLVAALLAAWRMSRLWLRRVDDIMLGMKHYSQGDYDFRASVAGRDELALLAYRLNELGHTLAAGRSARERWMADLSHELRTPLSVLQSQLEALQDGIRPLTTEAVDTLHLQVTRLNALVSDLQQLTLSDLGALSYQKVSVDMEQWLRDQTSLWQPLADKQGLNLTLGQVAAVKVLADTSRLGQLLANLLTNAIKYTNAPGSISLSSVKDRDSVRLVVEDSAPGLSDEALQRMFEPLFRGDSSRSETAGSGLGLSIAQRIAEAHDGVLSADASPLGGIRMTLVLPVLQREVT